MLQQNGYIQKGISIQSVYLDHKKHERNLLVAETYPKSIFSSSSWAPTDDISLPHLNLVVEYD